MTPLLRADRTWGRPVQKLHDRVKASADQFRKENPSFSGAIPADALTASASGLDPEISVANAQAQIAESRKRETKRRWKKLKHLSLPKSRVATLAFSANRGSMFSQ